MSYIDVLYYNVRNEVVTDTNLLTFADLAAIFKSFVSNYNDLRVRSHVNVHNQNG